MIKMVESEAWLSAVYFLNLYFNFVSVKNFSVDANSEEIKPA